MVKFKSLIWGLNRGLKDKQLKIISGTDPTEKDNFAWIMPGLSEIVSKTMNVIVYNSKTITSGIMISLSQIEDLLCSDVYLSGLA